MVVLVQGFVSQAFLSRTNEDVLWFQVFMSTFILVKVR
jgi:hypothetical protein